MSRRTSITLGVILILALGLALAGCAGSTQSTTSATRVKVDVGAPALPIVVEDVAVSASIETYVPPATLPLYEKKTANALTQESMEKLAMELGMENVTWAPRGFSNEDYAVEFPGGGEATCFNLWQKEPGCQCRLNMDPSLPR